MRFEIYEDKAGKWRWRFKSNGRIMADSGQGYASKGGCLKGINTMIRILRWEVRKGTGIITREII